MSWRTSSSSSAILEDSTVGNLTAGTGAGATTAGADTGAVGGAGRAVETGGAKLGDATRAWLREGIGPPRLGVVLKAAVVADMALWALTHSYGLIMIGGKSQSTYLSPNTQYTLPQREFLPRTLPQCPLGRICPHNRPLEVRLEYFILGFKLLDARGRWVRRAGQRWVRGARFFGFLTTGRGIIGA